MLNRHGPAGRFLGDKSFYKEVALVAIPIILQQLISTAMGFADGVMVGQIDAQAMASIMVANKYFMIMQSILFGVTGGLCIFISQYFGAHDHEKGQGFFVITVIGSMSVAGVFVILISAAPQAMLAVFVDDPATISYGISYLHYIRFSYLPFAFSLASMSALRSIGETRLPLLISSSAILLNTALNYLLIFGNFGFPEMGVAGAGLATLIARCLEMAAYIMLLGRNKQYFNLKISPVRLLNKSILFQVARKVIPLIGNEIVWSLGTAMIFKAYCLVDEPNIASLTITETTSNIIYALFGGFSAAVAVMVGTRLGAGKFDDARRNVRHLMVLGIAAGLFCGALLFILSNPITLLFNVEDTIRQMAGQMIRYQALLYPVILVNVIFFMTFRTGADMVATLAMDSFFIWIFVLPLAALLSYLIKPELPVFFLVIQGTELVKCLVAWLFFRRGKWLCNLT